MLRIDPQKLTGRDASR